MINHRNRSLVQNISCICLCAFFAVCSIERAESSERGRLRPGSNAGENPTAIDTQNFTELKTVDPSGLTAAESLSKGGAEIAVFETSLDVGACGNGVIDLNEQCDDGNTSNNDGCSNACQVEEGWQCTVPSATSKIPEGSFEGGTPNPVWTETSTNFGSPICDEASCGTSTGTGPADGSFWAWFGGLDVVEEASLSQTMVFPLTAEEMQFELEVSSCDSPSDYFEVLIDGNQEFFIDGSSSLCGSLGYTTQSMDISVYGDGAPHKVELHSESFAVNSNLSNFFVDDIRIMGVASVCTLGSVSLTLRKVVINDGGGSATASDWNLSATGPTSFSGTGPTVSSGDGFTAGSYDLTESGGPAGYRASDWVCIGGTQIDADTVTLALGQTVACTITNDDIDPDFEINTGLAGAWFNPDTSGQGVLVDLEAEEQFMFIAWFTYTDAASANPFEQRWLTAQGYYGGNTATLDLYETVGGAFDAPKEVTSTRVGDVTLSFTSCNQGHLSYTIDGEGLQGEFPLFRVIYGSGKSCENLTANTIQAVPINAGMDGAWFDPATSGQGFLIDSNPDEAVGNFIFVAWFTYGNDTASGQRWLTAQGGFEDSVAELDVYETTDGSFDDPRPPNIVAVGTMSLDFIDCSNAQLFYSLPADGFEGNIAIRRVISGGQAPCEDIAGLK